MKRLFQSTWLLAAALLAVYLLGLAVGLLVVYTYPVYQHRSFFYENARRIAEEYLVGTDETIRELSGPNTHILIFDAGGGCVLHVRPTAGRADSQPEAPYDADLSAVLAGQERFHPAFVSGRRNVTIITGVPVVDRGAVVGGVILLRNVMDLPEAATAFLIFYTAAYAAAVCFLALDRRRRRKYEALRQNYIANVTHALKAPIASVKALTETLSEIVEPDPNQQSVYYGMILREVNLQSRMVQEILELSKLQSNDTDLTREAVDAAGIFEEVRAEYEMLCECVDVTLHITDAALELPPLYTNAACLKQVLGILTDNALKFVDEGGEILIDASVSRRQATVCVRDDGVGIPKEDLPHVFERFYKAGGKRNEGGSGLGLAIAKEIIDGLKEKIWVKSEPGRGASFFFTVRIK